MTDTASDLTFLSDLPLAGTLVATDFDGWTVENVGDGPLVFTAVEHLDGANAPLPLT